MGYKTERKSKPPLCQYDIALTAGFFYVQFPPSIEAKKSSKRGLFDVNSFPGNGLPKNGYTPPVIKGQTALTFSPSKMAKARKESPHVNYSHHRQL